MPQTPAGRTGLFLAGYASSSRTGFNSAVIQVRVRNPGTVFRTVYTVALASSGSSTIEKKFDIPNGPLPEMTDVEFWVTEVDANDTGVAAGFTLLMRENE